mmetsp:Transcript_21166/g.39355  ORF Transcript_21166/g.39355 Transcript_21166/m.39355 type:complete len:116 (+) Transcript_21166:533-880(+)
MGSKMSMEKNPKKTAPKLIQVQVYVSRQDRLTQTQMQAMYTVVPMAEMLMSDGAPQMIESELIRNAWKNAFTIYSNAVTLFRCKLFRPDMYIAGYSSAVFLEMSWLKQAITAIGT